MWHCGTWHVGDTEIKLPFSELEFIKSFLSNRTEIFHCRYKVETQTN